MVPTKQFHIKKILIPYDFSETADLSLEHGIFMAQLLKAEVTLLHVVETVSFTSAIAHALGGMEKKIETATTKKLEELAQQIHRKSGIFINIKTEVGRIYRKIVSVARQTNADILIMGSHGVSGYQRFNLGTNTSRVISESPCPVLSVQTHAKQLGFKKIILPIDDTPSSRQKVIYAMELAKNYGSHISIAGLINFTNDDRRRKFIIKIEQVEEFLINHDITCDIRFLNGSDLGQMILQFAEEQDADLLVIMTDQEPTLTGYFMGSNANKVVNHSKIPVLSIHPKDTDPDKITVSY